MGRKWVHQKEAATLDYAITRISNGLPVSIVVLRHLEQDVFKTISIKELKLVMSVRYAEDNSESSHYNYLVTLMDGNGKETEKKEWPELRLAVDHYNSL